jgi:hypothetical protein
MVYVRQMADTNASPWDVSLQLLFGARFFYGAKYGKVAFSEVKKCLLLRSSNSAVTLLLRKAAIN